MPRKRGLCSIEDCGRPHFGCGFCYTHWRRWTRNGTTERLIGEHGQTHSPEYRSWVHMRRRCQEPNESEYANYGGRGITVCPEWERFETFLADMGKRPSLGHSIDRIDNHGPYAPWNCRWATRVEQNRNKRTNVFLTLDGRTQVMSAWSAELDIPVTTILARKARGLTDSDALVSNYRRRA